MPITSSAKKAVRVSARRKVENDRRKKTFREASKKLETLARAGSLGDAEKLLPAAYKAIDKAVKRGILKKNTAARKKSRLARIFSVKK